MDGYPPNRRRADVCLLFASRVARMLSYGALATVLLRFLAVVLAEGEVGTLLTGIIVGDIVITLLLTTRADAWGRRRTLIVGALLKAASGVVFASSTSFPVLLLAGVLGVISPTGGEIGPFLAVEQACLGDIAAADVRGVDGAPAGKEAIAAAIATVYGWYNAVGYGALALGALLGGWAVSDAQRTGAAPLDAYVRVLILYACLGGLKAALYALLSPGVEAAPEAVAAAGARAAAAAAAALPSATTPAAPAWRRWLPSSLPTLGLHRPESRRVVAALSALFAVDAFAGGFVMQTWLVTWFSLRWSVGDASLGALLAAANVAAGLSGAGAGYLVRRLGAVETMVVTHLPSNLLLMGVPLMPTAETAAALLVTRFTISQMDVPARQAYVASVVAPDERSAAGGVTNIVRSLGLALAPLPLAALTGAPPGSAAFSAPFFIAGVLKCGYDLTLWAAFVLSKRRAAAAAAAATAAAAEAAKGATTAERTAVATDAVSAVAEAPAATGAARAEEESGDGAEEHAALLPGDKPPDVP